ncbi:MAG: hypothetical protein P1U61_07775 [Legionellaceae bacterium]|nr:hypothetical protein [Legionellaceae bacterium]
MNQGKERLDKMFQEKKISEADYKVLITAMDKKSLFKKIESSILINPFQKIAGLKALIWGMMILVSMSFLGVIGQVYFIGVMGVLNAHALVKQAIDINFFLLAYQNLVSWIVLSSVFMATAKIFQKKRIRIIDFLGTVAFARFPLLIMTVCMALIQLVNPGFLAIDMTHGIPMKGSLAMSGFSVVILCLFIYQIAAYFFALKESSGLVGKKLWVSFIASFIVAEVIIQPLAVIFMN